MKTHSKLLPALLLLILVVPQVVADEPPVNDEREGLETAWYSNGQMKYEFHYKDGMLVSASVWKPDGKPCPIPWFRLGRRRGNR